MEQLLKPRVKVIAGWPGKYSYSPGDIITRFTNGSSFNTDEEFIAYYQQWPHLFKQAAWYEERTREELEAVKFVKVLISELGQKYCPYYARVSDCLNGGLQGYILTGFELPDGTDGSFTHFSCLAPATEQEYNDYLKSTKTQ